MSDELCRAIVKYLAQCDSDSDLSNTGREVVTSHQYGLLTDEERDRIFAAGRKRRAELKQSGETA